MSIFSIRTFLKKTADLSLNPMGLTLERFFGKNLELRKAIQFANERNVDLLLDVGANRGQYAESILKAGFQGNILSFEPVTEAYNILQNKSDYHWNWDVYEKCAIGAKEGFREIAISQNEYSSSFLNVNKEHLSVAPQALCHKKETVKVITLDSAASHISGHNLFLKIETQGYEDRVLLGAAEIILKKTRLIQIELSLLELYADSLTIERTIPLLRRLGFEPLFFSPGFTDRETNEIQQIEGFFAQK